MSTNSLITPKKIRKLDSGDASRVFEILEENRSHSADFSAPAWSEAQVAKECLDQDGWIIEAQNRNLVAFILYRKAADVWEVSYLSTSVAARSQGLMTELIGHMIRHLPHGVAIWLEVHESNANARRLYAKTGFQEVGKRSRYYSDGGTAILYNYG